jgi:salicylate hydroxylase
MPGTISPVLHVAIVGGGPGGLSSAIALSKLEHVQVTIYEQARELREIGAGIQIGYNCWKVLELLGAEANVKGHVHETILQRCVQISHTGPID